MPAERALQLAAALLPLFTPLPRGALADPVTADIGCGDTGAAAVGAGGSAHWAFEFPPPPEGGGFDRLGELVFATCETGGDTVLTVDGHAYDNTGGCGLELRNERVAIVPAAGRGGNISSSVAILIQVHFYNRSLLGTVRLGVTCSTFSPATAPTTTAPTTAPTTTAPTVAGATFAPTAPPTTVAPTVATTGKFKCNPATGFQTIALA